MMSFRSLRASFASRRLFPGLLVAAILLSGGIALPAVADDGAGKTTARLASVRLSETDIYDMALGFTCYIKVPQANGQGSSLGTGWIVDKERRLVLTNHHVIDGGTGKPGDVSIWFPVKENGEVLSDTVHYEKNITPFHGTVIDSDSTKDLALIELNSLPGDAVAPVIAQKSPRPGEHIHTVAGSALGSHALWVYTTGVVKAVYKKRTQLSNSQIVFARAVEAQAAVNQGNSGGPVLNDQGEVVAVISSSANGANDVQSFIDQEEVRAYLETVVPLVNPETADAFNLRGIRHYNAERYAQAIADLNAALRLDEEHAVAYSNRGWAHLQTGELEIALGDFTDAIERDPKSTEARLGRGIVLRKLERTADSLSDLNEAIRGDNGSDTLYNLYNERGITYYADEQYPLALADFQKAVELADREGGEFTNFSELVHVSEVTRDAAQLHVNCGDALLGLNRPQEAMQSYEKALTLAPNRWDFAFAMGKAIEAAGDAARAIQLFRAVIENDKSDPEFFRALGKSLRNQELLKDAAEVFAAGADLHTSDADLCNELGVTLYMGGAYENAAKAYALAIERDNQNAVYFRNRGQAFGEYGELQLALADLDEAIRLNAGDAEFFFLRGKLRERSGDGSGAEADYRQAEQMDSTTYRREFRRYFQVENATDQTLHVTLKYETLTTSGDWTWFGDSNGGGLSYEIAPGQKVNLFHDDFRIIARRVVIAAKTDGGSQWNAEEIQLAPREGYLATGDDESAHTHVHRFTL